MKTRMLPYLSLEKVMFNVKVVHNEVLRYIYIYGFPGQSRPVSVSAQDRLEPVKAISQ